MSKVIPFSRTFPGYHPRKGQPTQFAENIYNDLAMPCEDDLPEFLMHLNPHLSALHIVEFCKSLDWKGEANGWPKRHTIRAGHRWKVGDKFSPRVWSGRPYHTPQITIDEDLTVEKVYDFTIKEVNGRGRIWIENKMIFEEDEFIFFDMEELATNDGLNLNDFLHWFKFPKPFDGQIIAWN